MMAPVWSQQTKARNSIDRPIGSAPTRPRWATAPRNITRSHLWPADQIFVLGVLSSRHPTPSYSKKRRALWTAPDSGRDATIRLEYPLARRHEFTCNGKTHFAGLSMMTYFYF